ncbi:MAG: chorismate mutase [Pseudomonadota bacterium]
MATPPSNPDDLSRLNALRARLDAVDTGIHRLLRERFEIVEEIGKAKGPQESVIRPGREAAVIENRLALHSGAMPREMLAHIWRTVMSAACTVQRPFRVYTVGALDVALFLYGPVEVIVAPDVAAALSALGGDDIAVLAGETAWWQIPDGADVSVINRCPLTRGGSVIVYAGHRVPKGTGPEAAIVRNGAAQFVASSSLLAEDHVLGRYHPFPLEIPGAEASAV